MATAGSIVVDLLARTGAFETDMKRAENRLQNMAKVAKQAGAVLGSALVAGATAAAVSIKGAIDRMDEMSKAALRAQMPTEEFSRLAYAGSLADVSMQDLTTSMGRLARAQSDAQRGLKTQTDAFDELGISFEDANGNIRNGTEVLKDFADVVQRRKDDPEVLAAGMQIFGRSFQNLIPLLSQGRVGLEEAATEADRLGITLGTEAGQQAEAFNDNLTRLQTAALGLSNAVAAELLPDLVNLTGEMVNAGTEGEKLKEVASDISDAFRGIASFVGVLVDGFKLLSGVVRGVMLDLIALGNVGQASLLALTGDLNGAVRNIREAGVARGMAAEASADIARVFAGGSQTPQGRPTPIFADEGPVPEGFYRMSAAEAAARARADADDARRAAAREQARAKPPARATAGAKKSDAELEAERLQQAYESMNTSLRQQIALYGDAGRAGSVAWETTYGALQDLDPAMKTILQEQAEWLDWMDEMADIEKVWADGQQEQVDRVIASWDVATDKMTVFAEEAGRNMQDAFANFLFDPFANGLDGLASGFSEMLRKMAAEWMASEIFRMVGEWGKNNSGQGGIVGTVAGIAGSVFGGSKAGGGDTIAGRSYWVGEEGPEMFVPRTAGTIIPSEGSAQFSGDGSGRGVQQVNNFAFAAPTSSKTQTQIAAKTAFEIARARRLG